MVATFIVLMVYFLPALTFAYLNFLDYYTTVVAFKHGGFELNSSARELLTADRVSELIYHKAVFMFLWLILYGVGLYLAVFRGVDDVLYVVGLGLLGGFTVGYMALLYAVLQNVLEILQAL